MIRVSFILILVFALTGCTLSLWSPKLEPQQIDGFYVKSDTNQLFVTASDTAYLFDIPQSFGKALTLSRRVHFSPRFSDFAVDQSNQVSGEVSLTLKEQAPSKARIKQLKGLGFNQDPVLKKWRLTTKLQGKRYTVTGTLPLEKLAEPLTVMVAQPRAFAETAGKIVATPVTITFDAMVTVPAVFIGATVMALGSP